MSSRSDMIAFRDHCRQMAEQTFATGNALTAAGRGQPAGYLEQLDRDAHLWAQIAREIDDYLDHRTDLDVDDQQTALFAAPETP